MKYDRLDSNVVFNDTCELSKSSRQEAVAHNSSERYKRETFMSRITRAILRTVTYFAWETAGRCDKRKKL